MNMRSLTVILGALSAFALGACTVTSTTSGSGGSTSATGTGGEASGVGGAGGGTTATGTSTGTSMCDAKYTCSEALDGDPTKLCEGPSAMLYDTYYACVCETGGACFSVCSDNACKDGTKSADCTACLQKNDMGCAKEFTDCSGDVPN
jgi:hypothetical protein